MFAAMLSGGQAVHQIPQESTRESGLSQIFLAIDPSAQSASSAFAMRDELDRIAAGILDSLHAAVPIDPAKPVRYPGEQTLRLRQENMKLGVPVDPAVWARLQALSF